MELKERLEEALRRDSQGNFVNGKEIILFDFGQRDRFERDMILGYLERYEGPKSSYIYLRPSFKLSWLKKGGIEVKTWPGQVEIASVLDFAVGKDGSVDYSLKIEKVIPSGLFGSIRNTYYELFGAEIFGLDDDHFMDSVPLFSEELR